MPKKLDHVEAAKEEAERLGAELELGYCSRHIVGVIAINEQKRKIFMSKSTANRSVCHIVRLGRSEEGRGDEVLSNFFLTSPG